MLSLLLMSCGAEETAKSAGKYGTMDSNSPEYAAIQFFEHIYNDPTIERSLQFSSPKMARLIKSYRINHNVQRHVLNMTFDTVEIKPNAGSAGRNEFAKEVKVSMFFEGTYHGDKIRDLRTVKLIRIGQQWKVDEVSLD